MEHLTACDLFPLEIMDQEKEHIRYLSKDIAFLKELREGFLDESDWEMEQTISELIHEETQLMDSCKRRWLNAQSETYRLERLRRSRPSSEFTRNGAEAKTTAS